MPDVFVSYSRQDSSFVTQLAEAIESSGKQVWIDTSGIEDTEVFPRVIRSAIESSDAFLFVISPASVASRFCEQEVDYAVSLNKRLVPVLRAHVADDALPEPIRERSWIPFEADTEFDESFSRVLNALETDLDYRRSHTRWLTKAIEWDSEQRDPSLLLRGNELRGAEAWSATTTERSDPAPTALQREYLLASRQATGRRSRVFVAGSTAVTLVAVALLVFALISRSQAVQDKVASSAQALAVESQNDLAIDPEASVILAMRAVEQEATPQTMLALREALDASPLVASLPTIVAPALCDGSAPSVAFRPGTDEIAENACSGGIVVAHAQTGTIIRQLSSVTSGTGVAYNPAGTLLALGTQAGVTLLNPTTGAVEKTLLLAGYGVVSPPLWITFSPSGTMIGAASGNNGLQSALFNVHTGRELPLGGAPASNGPADSTTALAFTANGRFVVTGEVGAGPTPVFNATTGALVRTLKTGPLSLNGFSSFVATCPNPKVPLLAVAFNTDAGSGRVEIWNTTTWRKEFVFATTSHVQYTSLAFSPDGARLAVGEANGVAGVWSIPTRSEIVPLLGQTAAIQDISFSPDGSEVATTSVDGTVRVWRATGPEHGDLYLNGSIESVGLSAHRVGVASLYRGRVEVSLWNSVSDAEIHQFTIPGSSSFDVVSVSPDARYVADFEVMPSNGGLNPSGVVLVYSVATGLPSGVYPVAGAEAMAWSSDDHEIAVVSQGLEVVSLKTHLAVAFQVTGAEQCGTDGPPAFSEGGALIAWATACGDVAVFRLSGESRGEPEGKPVASFPAQGRPSGVAFNPAGTELAVSSLNGAVTVFNPLTGQREISLPTVSSEVTSVAYSSDGHYLATTLLNGSTEVWGAVGPMSGELERIDQDSAPLLVAPAFAVGTIAFATGDTTGTVKIWPECPACGDPNLLLTDGRRQLVSGLTPLEQVAER